MEINHILLVFVFVLALAVVAYLLTKPKYYKETTVYLFYESEKTRHDRVVFIKEGLDAPEDLLDEIEKKRKEIEKEFGVSPVLTNIKIFKPQWRK